ncbi:hypothetical protein Drorol1_Dr00020211, partial [Drosera rotundifolia]
METRFEMVEAAENLGASCLRGCLVLGSWGVVSSTEGIRSGGNWKEFGLTEHGEYGWGDEDLVIIHDALDYGSCHLSQGAGPAWKVSDVSEHSTVAEFGLETIGLSMATDAAKPASIRKLQRIHTGYAAPLVLQEIYMLLFLRKVEMIDSLFKPVVDAKRGGAQYFPKSDIGTWKYVGKAQWTLLKAAATFWDPFYHIFHFDEQELCPLLEEFEANLGRKSAKWLIAPSLEDEDVALMGFYLFSESPGHFHPRVLSLAGPLLNGGFVGGIIVADTYRVLYRMKNGETPNYLFGSPWLLQVWLQERLMMLEKPVVPYARGRNLLNLAEIILVAK